jgi:hypothetical protein
MESQAQPKISGSKLVEAWSQTLPGILNATDSVKVTADATNPRAVQIHINTAGHTGYSFDFSCAYVDDREVKVDFRKGRKEGEAILDGSAPVNHLLDDYIRHIHECAQALQADTHQ